MQCHGSPRLSGTGTWIGPIRASLAAAPTGQAVASTSVPAFRARWMTERRPLWPDPAIPGDDVSSKPPPDGTGNMLQVFGFDRIGVVLGDIYFIDPNPAKGQEGPERGVRLEVRMLQPGELAGSIYSSRPITIAEPVWRADFLESADGPRGSLNRAPHHPGMHRREPRKRALCR